MSTVVTITTLAHMTDHVQACALHLFSFRQFAWITWACWR